MSWTQKHPEHWTQNEILDWIYFVASEIDVDPTTIRGEGFQNITGPQLCRMSLEDFLRSDPVNGKCFYDMFRSLHKDGKLISLSWLAICFTWNMLKLCGLMTVWYTIM